jgi:beta-glucosidase
MKLSMTITNTRKMDGAVVAQVYITEKNAPVLRPAKELKGFKKVFLKPVETKQDEIELPVKTCAYFNEKTQSFSLNAGQLEIHVGNASNNIKAKAVVKIK